MYSHCKVLLGVAPRGVITFVSKAWDGQTSDMQITNHSGFLELLEPGDVVIGDKGFPQIDAKYGVTVVRPPQSNSMKFTKEQMDETNRIARVRIHIERVIGRLKQFEILQHRIPVSLFSYMDSIIRLCCVLTNYSPQTIQTNEDDEKEK